jgi:penicillin G amidase
MRRLKWPVLVIVILTACLSVAIYSILKRTRPTLEGSLVVTRLASPVKIARDIYAIPHIIAENPHDLFLAQGFVTAQDRLWQMDLTRRIALGRLSEIFGEETVDMDYFMRASEIDELAKKIYGYLDDQTRSELLAFADGVNCYMNSGKRPIESLILRYKIEPWTPTDTISIHLLYALNLSINMDEEIFVNQAIKLLGEKKAKSIFKDFRVETFNGVKGATKLMRRDSDFMRGYRIAKQMFGLFSSYGASNGWVVDGTKSASGKPMLANDPHMRIRIPSVWYEIHLRAPGINAIGATFPGTPYVMIGHNEKVAWGFTDSMADRVDLFIEKLKPDDTTKYWFQHHWENIRTKTVEIRVKSKSGYTTLAKEINYTRHGLIINPFRTGQEDILSMKWSASEVEDRTLVGLSKLNRAKGVKELMSGGKYGKIYTQNMIFADVDGNIGYQLVGGIPNRLKGNGKFPVPGWSGEYEWRGFIPDEALPYSLNPTSHFIVTANNKLLGEDYPYLISNSWVSPYRSRRITSLLDENNRLSIRDFEHMQADVHSLPASLFVQSIRGIKANDPDVKWALDELSNWDCDVTSKSMPTLLYEVTRFHLLRNTFEDELGEIFPSFLQNLEFNTKFIDDVIADPDSVWWDKVDTKEREKRKDIVLMSVKDATADIKGKLGAKTDGWVWGAVHKYKFEHPLGKVRGLGYIFDPNPVPAEGDRDTINNSYFSYDNPFDVNKISSYRVIVDLSDMDNAISMNSTGQSGDPLSRFYSDNIRKWARGEYKTLFFDKDSIERNSWKQLWLLPESRVY